MDALIKTLDYLTKTNVFVVDLLQKGLTENKIKQILKTKGLKVRDEIKELYQIQDIVLKPFTVQDISKKIEIIQQK